MNEANWFQNGKASVVQLHQDCNIPHAVAEAWPVQGHVSSLQFLEDVSKSQLEGRKWLAMLRIVLGYFFKVFDSCSFAHR